MAKRLRHGRKMRATDLGLFEDPIVTASRAEGYDQALRDVENVIYTRQNRHEAFGLLTHPETLERYNEGEMILSGVMYLRRVEMEG